VPSSIFKPGRYWYILENNAETPERTFALADMDIERSSSGHERTVDVDEIDGIGWFEPEKRCMSPRIFLLISKFFSV